MTTSVTSPAASPSARNGSRIAAWDGDEAGIDDDREVALADERAGADDAGPGAAGEQDVDARVPRRGCIGHDGASIAEDPVANARPTISTHVLDLASGAPAAGVGVALFRLDEDGRPSSSAS